jgi:5-methylcytosine-specific restriction endonuclease McrA
MSEKISEAMRRQVAARAGYRCEYCRRLEADSFIRYQIDHIISRKHGGKTSLDNLAYACPVCNNAKGSDLSTMLPGQDHLVRLFHPRKDNWFEHFEAFNAEIKAKTDVGEATVNLLKMNDVERILERLDLAEAGLFP